MATDTVPAAVPGPSDPPGQTTAGDQAPRSFLASMVAPVDPARPTPTFDLTPTDGTTTPGGGPDAPLDRSTPGVTSASFRGTTNSATQSSDPAGARHKRSVWKEFWLAAATRWAKGGGTANKRLDLAKAQAQAYQVKENRTTSVMKSPGLPVRNTGGSGAAVKKDPGKGPVNSTGNGSAGSGRGGAGGGRGPAGGSGAGGGSGSRGNGSAGRDTKGTGPHSKGEAGTRGKDKPAAGGDKGTRNEAGKTPGKAPGSGTGGGAGKPGSAGSAGKNGKDGAAGKPGTGGDAKGGGKKTDLTKAPKDASGGKGAQGAPGAGGSGGHPGTEKTPLQKSRETGHGDGSKARRVVDHVRAYKDGARDGWSDEKTKNAKEHDRLDKAHDAHKPKPDTQKPGQPDPQQNGPQAKPQPGPLTVAGTTITTDKGDDGVSTDVKPLLVKDIDANTITLGTQGAKGTVSRKELRNFKQYERKLEAKETVLHKIADACRQLQKEAENEAKECQDLAEQAKGVKGGEKVIGKLNRLAEAAKNQAVEAAELARRAKRAAEMCKVVLTNIQTRYAPLYKAVKDSGETKPAELRFYNDKGSYAPAA